MRLLTPARLRENEDAMWKLADEQIDGFIGRGSFDVIADFAQPFTMLVIAELLGVPTEDYEMFLRIARKHEVGIVPEPLVVYVVRRNGISGSKAPTAVGSTNASGYGAPQYDASVSGRPGGKANRPSVSSSQIAL